MQNLAKNNFFRFASECWLGVIFPEKTHFHRQKQVFRYKKVQTDTNTNLWHAWVLLGAFTPPNRIFFFFPTLRGSKVDKTGGRAGAISP